MTIHNIPSFMGGRCLIENASKDTCGLVDRESGAEPENFKDFLHYREVSSDDGTLEICTLRSILQFALLNFKRVAQTQGPIDLKFKENAPAAYF
jgi:hypothetical protein